MTDAVLIVARKEVREIWRDGRFWAIGGAVTGLLVVALAFGARQARVVAAERAAATAAAEQQWQDQDAKNPHVAAHFGKYAFKPAGVLAFLDPGVEPFLGVSIKLEAHKRNALGGASARDATGLSRFGRLSAASVLQLLVPLLVIGLGFATWTSERQRGTLRQLASQGVSTGVLLAGKAVGLVAALALVIAPAAAFGAAAVMLLSDPDAGLGGTGGRLVAVAAAHLAYFLVWVMVTLTVSATARSSRAALVTLLALWVATGLVIPRAATDAAARIAPAPSTAEVKRAVERSLAEGLRGSGGREERVSAISEAMLEREGWKGAETLMDASLLEGIELQAEAAFENEVLDHHHRALAAAAAREESLFHGASAASPMLAIRALSMAFAGTDHAHHRHFELGAERYRRDLVDMLNRDFTERAGTESWNYKAGRELWARAPAFHHTPPPLSEVARAQTISLGALAAWIVVSTWAAWRSAARMRVF